MDVRLYNAHMRSGIFETIVSVSAIGCQQNQLKNQPTALTCVGE